MARRNPEIRATELARRVGNYRDNESCMTVMDRATPMTPTSTRAPPTTPTSTTSESILQIPLVEDKSIPVTGQQIAHHPISN